ncbi:lamin-like protein [Chrysoperla carnea]|uniref:lamin-like protein n=1 Tax=Chrysoperla carnea TaxID=189513 RepID=UPI001D089908|nr:lamin-like protein [Chrysoperla carnea]
MSRKVKNERYYVQEIHKHTDKINKELKRIRGEISELKSTSSLKDKVSQELAKLEEEKQALENESQKLRFIINICNNKARLDDVQKEIQEKQNENRDLLIRLEDIYISRKNKERNIEAIKTAISEENAILERELDKLSRNDRIEYLRMKQDLESVQKEIKDYENTLGENNEKMEFYMNKIDHPIKKSLFNLISEYETLREEHENLSQIIRNKGSVKHEEEQLLTSIRDTRIQVQSIEAETKNYQQKLESVQEIIDGLDKDLKEGYSARHGKYLELMKREEKMNQFIESAVEKIDNIKKMSDAADDSIVEGLNFWSLHLDELDDGEFDTDDVNTAKQEYQMQLTRLHNITERISQIKTEINELRDKKMDIEKQLLEQDDPEEVKEVIQGSIETFTAEKDVLSKKISATVSAIEVAIKTNKELTEKLAKNQSYAEIKQFEEKIDDLQKMKNEFLGRINVLNESTNTEKIAEETLALINTYNKMLTQSG